MDIPVDFPVDILVGNLLADIPEDSLAGIPVDILAGSLGWAAEYADYRNNSAVPQKDTPRFESDNCYRDTSDSPADIRMDADCQRLRC